MLIIYSIGILIVLIIIYRVDHRKLGFSVLILQKRKKRLARSILDRQEKFVIKGTFKTMMYNFFNSDYSQIDKSKIKLSYVILISIRKLNCINCAFQMPGQEEIANRLTPSPCSHFRSVSPHFSRVDVTICTISYTQISTDLLNLFRFLHSHW